MQTTFDREPYSRIDYAFARFLSQRTALTDTQKKAFESLVALLSYQQHQGHTCIEITDKDRKILLESGFTCETPAPVENYPLVIEENRLYLQRYWVYEDRLARQIKRLAHISFPVGNLENLLGRYFGSISPETDWQREAAKTAYKQAFCIITGGPGTGKTTTVCKILAILQELSPGPLLTALAAPTGKAAMRLQEAIAHNLDLLDLPEAVKKHIPLTAITLHRLLGANPPSPYFKHDASNPLMYDLVVVDEASMVDLAMMSKLVAALKPGGRLILLGDKDQLASVESGAVLADLILGLPNNTVELTRSYRFDDSIKRLSEAINRQDHEAAWAILDDDDETTGLLGQDRLLPYILERRRNYQNLINSKAAFADIWQSFNQFQVLCANRHGKNGVRAINAAVERELFGLHGQKGTAAWYPGRPVIVTQNNPGLHLYNGDIGICLPDEDQDGNLMVFFQRPGGTIKKYLPARIPGCETVFAMTIHKSQGSEYDDILIVLPETPNPILSKELLYTAVTRARDKIKIVTEKALFNFTLDNKVARNSGLWQKLY